VVIIVGTTAVGAFERELQSATADSTVACELPAHQYDRSSGFSEAA